MNSTPNIIVFFTDQQRHDSTGVHGNPLGLTPNFDRIAAEGTDIHYSFTCAPVCGPARACMQTGTHISTNGVYINGITLPKHLPHLASSFNDAGYHTGYIGKWHLSKYTPENNQGLGAVPKKWRSTYQSWLAHNCLEWNTNPYDPILFDESDNKIELPGYRVDAQADAMIRYINEHKKEPFFLFSSFIEPHQETIKDSYTAPTGYRKNYAGKWTPPDLAALPGWGFDGSNENHRRLGGNAQQQLGSYWGMVKRLDEALGRILDALKSLSLEENTIVLFTSDHACHFKTRNQEYKRSCHESSIRVPTAITGPGFWSGGRVQQMFSLIDIPPTLLDAAGIDIPQTFEGHSLLQGRKNNFKGWPEEMFVQVCDNHVGRAVRTKRWKYCIMGTDPKNDWKKPAADSYTESFLYDLEHDPYELRNLINLQSHENVRRVMRERLVRRMTSLGEPEPKIILAQV